VVVSTVRSVSCLLFFYSRCPPRAQPFVKVGARAPVSHGVGATDSTAAAAVRVLWGYVMRYAFTYYVLRVCLFLQGKSTRLDASQVYNDDSSDSSSESNSSGT